MIIGFTGTRKGMTADQAGTVQGLLIGFNEKPELLTAHHGDCVGADEEFHDTIRALSKPAYIIVHPPINDRYRAFCGGDRILPPKDYLIRNDDIVRESELLIAAPENDHYTPRSGTWSTYLKGMKKGIPVYLVLPNGKLETYN